MIEELIERLEKCFPDSPRPWPLHEPRFSGRDSDLVLACIESGWVSSVGSYVDRFEEDLCKVTGSQYAVAVVNGTAALHLALIVAGVQPGDEVLIPTLSFVATANSVHLAGGIPHFVDSDPETLGLDADCLDAYLRDTRVFDRTKSGLVNRKTGAVVRAIVPMHTFGQPVPMAEILTLAHEFELRVIEDAAEALGSSEKGEHMGTLGHAGCFSFNGNKILTTGGGGAVITDDEAFAAKVRHLSTTAKEPHPWAFSHDERGFNYRLPNLNAALGCSQLERFSETLKRKRRVAQLYQDALTGWKGGEVFKERAGVSSNYWLNALLLHSEHASVREEILESLNRHGIMARPAWNLLHSLRPYQDCPTMLEFPGAESIFDRTISLPSGPGLLGNDPQP